MGDKKLDSLKVLNGRHCENCDSRGESVFCDLPPEALSILDKGKSINHYKRGQSVFHTGNPPIGLYCVNSGVVKLEVSGLAGQGHILRMVGPGGVLGYRALFSDEPYHASAVIHEDASICFIHASSVKELLAKHPSLALKFLAQVSRELRETEDRMVNQADKSAAERIAEAVLFLQDHFEDEVWTRKEIAEWAGTTPETVMRALAEFEDEGLLTKKGRRIVIKDRKGMIERANLLY